ncbi:hypothetical protein QQ045_031693 [Rhodiola kirilowii]
MASRVRQCGGVAGGTIRFKSSSLNGRLPNLVPMKKFKSGCKVSISATMELSSVKATNKRDRYDGSLTKINHDRIHKWMWEEVVEELVKNLKQAPLLVQVYDKAGDGSSARLKMKKAVAKEWPNVKESWSGSGEAPEGVIFVEELDEEEDESNKSWGIVIQVRGREYEPARYLLKTTGVTSGDVTCTPFIWTYVTPFPETAFSPLTGICFQ